MMHDHLSHLATGASDGWSSLGALVWPESGPLLVALFAAGLASGFTHCAGMCGPFVMAQVANNLARVQQRQFTALTRLRSVALLRYHVGRLTTYSALGAVAGGAAGTVVETTGFRWLLALFLGAAALYFVANLAGAFAKFSRGRGTPLARLGERLARLAIHHQLGPYGLGVALGFLPCGLVYGALGAAAGGGGVLAGWLAMVAFGLGTMPGLIAAGYGGSFLTTVWRTRVAAARVPLVMLNAAVLGVLALRAFV